MLKTAQEVIASGDERAVVDYAVEVNRSISLSQVELEAAKVFLRKVAEGRRREGDSVEIDGHLGVATVKFQYRSDVKQRKGRDLRDIEENLSEEAFRRLFIKTVQIHPVQDLPELIGTLSVGDREVVERFLEITPKTSKVFLTK